MKIEIWPKSPKMVKIAKNGQNGLNRPKWSKMVKIVKNGIRGAKDEVKRPKGLQLEVWARRAFRLLILI